MGYVKGEAPGQSSLFPVSLDELVTHYHVVCVIEAYVDRLDLTAPGFTKTITKRTGRPPYSPSELLYLYGYLHRIRSSRRWRPNASATLKSCGYSAVWRQTTRPLRISGTLTARGLRPCTD